MMSLLNLGSLLLAAILGIIGTLGRTVDDQTRRLTPRGWITISLIILSCVASIVTSKLAQDAEEQRQRAQLIKQLSRISTIQATLTVAFAVDKDRDRDFLTAIERLGGSQSPSSGTVPAGFLDAYSYRDPSGNITFFRDSTHSPMAFPATRQWIETLSNPMSLRIRIDGGKTEGFLRAWLELYPLGVYIYSPNEKLLRISLVSRDHPETFIPPGFPTFETDRNLISVEDFAGKRLRISLTSLRAMSAVPRPLAELLRVKDISIDFGGRRLNARTGDHTLFGFDPSNPPEPGQIHFLYAFPEGERDFHSRLP